MPNETVSKLKQLQAEATDALDDVRLAQRESHQISRFQAFVHFWVLVSRSFVRHRCPIRASSLAYASLLAMVPMIAVVISVSASLLKTQGELPIQQFIDSMVARMTPEARVPGAPAAETSAGTVPPGGKLLDPAEYAKTRREMVAKINEFVSNIRSGALGVTGMIALLFVAISMLARIEDTFNDIWGVTRGRSWFARVIQYWAAITLGPVVLAATLTLTSGSQFQATRDFIGNLGVAGAWAVKLGMAVLPYAIWSGAFALFYQLMPNTRVHWQAALAGGLVGGCLWQLNTEFSVLYVSRVVTNSRIYGSLGIVPVFMIGLYFAWLILLFGAQVAYAFQNRRSYLQEKQVEGVNERGREFVALRLATHVAAGFLRGEHSRTLTQLAEAAAVPTRLAGSLLHTLVTTKLLVEVNEREPAYTPARPLDQITAGDVLRALRSGTGLELATRDDPMRTLVREQVARIDAAEAQVASRVTLQELAQRVVQVGDSAAVGTGAK